LNASVVGGGKCGSACAGLVLLLPAALMLILMLGGGLSLPCPWGREPSVGGKAARWPASSASDVLFISMSSCSSSRDDWSYWSLVPCLPCLPGSQAFNLTMQRARCLLPACLSACLLAYLPACLTNNLLFRSFLIPTSPFFRILLSHRMGIWCSMWHQQRIFRDTDTLVLAR
jgi:hypothetical protein